MRFEADGNAELVLSIGEKVDVWSRATGEQVSLTATDKGIEVEKHG